jgi:glycerol-3-phosphate dehydrogenase
MRSRPESIVFDVAVIGGGIIGAGIARDAARRGLRVALFERDDFGGGTTSASTRLAHGGLRYLASADFRLVRMDLRERETLLRIAPHLVSPLPFLLPFFRGQPFERLRLRAGMLLYDALSYDKTLPAHRILGEAGVGEIEPALDRRRLSGAALFYDAQIHSPERLTIENVVDAVAHGAYALNHAEVVGGVTQGDRLAGVKIRDRLSGDEFAVAARLVVNAAGPWLDLAGGRVAAAHRPLIRTTKGVHVACAPFTRTAVVLPSAIDQRVVFAIPWAGYTWIGTTDTDFTGDPATASATDADVRYLIDSVAPLLPAARTATSHWACAGVRALVRSEGSASDVSRMHRIVREAPGLMAIAGGKITGYRAIAEEATDDICRQLGVHAASTTRRAPLPGGGPERSGDAGLDAVYGSRADRVVALAACEPGLDARLAPAYPDIAAQVVFAARYELCARLEDFMLRRSYLGFRPDRGIDAAENAARWMQKELGWSDERRRDEVARYHFRVAADRPGPTIERHVRTATDKLKSA